MTREKFVKLSGWGFMFGVILVFVGFLAGSRPDYNVYNAASLPIDRIANSVDTWIITAGLLMFSVGFVGLYITIWQTCRCFQPDVIGFWQSVWNSRRNGRVWLGLF